MKKQPVDCILLPTYNCKSTNRLKKIIILFLRWWICIKRNECALIQAIDICFLLRTTLSEYCFDFRVSFKLMMATRNNYKVVELCQEIVT